MNIPFIKMHGLGNDFVIVDSRQNTVPSDKDFIAKISIDAGVLAVTNL